MIVSESGKNIQSTGQEKILLLLLPYWTPQIPPLGISSLKSFLQHRYRVKTMDLNTRENINDIYYRYFDRLAASIPGDMQGNFYNIGHDVLRNHMMAHLYYENEKQYIELVKVVIYKTFFTHVSDDEVRELNRIISGLYTILQETVTQLLHREKPGVLGLSVYSGNLPASLFTFKLAKERYPGIMTVMGGGIFADQLDIGSPNFEFFLTKTPYIDKLIVGEGELLFFNLLEGRLQGSQRVYTREDIHHETLDLSHADIPDFSDFDLNLYPHLSSYVSRSCPFQCSFCSETVQWGKYRKKDPGQIVRELTQLYNTYGSQLFLLGDSLLNPVVEGLARELVQSGESLYWDGYLRADPPVCDPENTLFWRRGGFYRARLGLESGSPHVLAQMGKKITPRQMKDAVVSLASAGIKTTTYWVIGYPGETEADFQQTLNLIAELKNDIYEAECNPFNYYLTGQVKSDSWNRQNKSYLLYPGEAKDMLIVQTWVMDCPPSREETYSRVRRFVEHCKRLEIPNPYSIREIDHADQRWRKLHKNAVPPLAQFKNSREYIDECKGVKKLNTASGMLQDNITFRF